jgi:hypothetical protein
MSSVASDQSRLPEDHPDPPATAIVPSTDSSQRLWLPVLLGILCAAAFVAALFGLTLLAIWWRG